MKEIVYNEYNLNNQEINNIIKRAKIIIINSNDEILLTCSNKNYFLIGGHVENNETDKKTLIRETLEETGIELKLNTITPFFSITYYTKNYPIINQNTKYITNYYYIKLDVKPNSSKINLTEGERKGNFKLHYIHKNNIIEILTNSIKNCTRKNVVRDTISALEEFLKLYK